MNHKNRKSMHEIEIETIVKARDKRQPIYRIFLDRKAVGI